MTLITAISKAAALFVIRAMRIWGVAVTALASIRGYSELEALKTS
jgi:hypothetical protein